MNNNEHVCKVKGVTLNHNNSKVLNFNTVKDFILSNVLDGVTNQLETQHMQFKKHIETKTITTEYITKKYNFNYDKCKIVYTSNNKIDTLPYGHKDIVH